ncbi:MAG: S9 family peptidase [Paludibacteraceae bacterium]|nr:S9 family peptidase [Paludibacteraceae bacterium]
MRIKPILMAVAALCVMSCNKNQESDQTPITKPQITIEGGRLTPEALWAMGRINTAIVDIETGWIAYTVSYYSVTENRSTTWIRICAEQEGQLQVIDEFVGSDPAWFGGSGVLAYLNKGHLTLRQSKKDIPVELAGGDAQCTMHDVEGFLLSPMRDKVVLIKQVKTVETTQEKYPDLDKATGRVVDDLMYKHWDEWTETAPQPFVCELQLEYKGEMTIKSASLSNPVNILEGTTFESPMKPFGGVEQLAWSPDNKTIAYTCRKKTGKEYALSTNSDIYTYDISARAHANLTEGMMGYDTNPMFSPDGSKIAWLSMERDGYESDQNRLFIMDLATGEKTFVSKELDTNVDEYFWSGDSVIIFSACWHGEIGIYKLNIDNGASGYSDKYTITQIRGGQYDYQPVDYIDGHIYYLRHSMCEANELFVDDTQLTFENKNIYDQITMGTVIPRWQKTTQGEDMLTWIILPPNFDENKQYPTLLYCEGGPQSPVSQFWSYRWNFMMMAANGYVVVAPNRHGLPGFGQAWCEQISGDYGGQCMQDYLSAIDEACANLPYVDKDHLGCVGASFGGFSVYWLAGHHDKRFKAFIAHDGIFNLEMQYLETEEKWFANWDMGGAYWDKENAVAQRTFANSPHKFVDQWNTPILCIHGEKDYRILANQAMAAFDAAKMRGVDAQLLIFPDENHWVLKPQNGILWQRTFFGWLDKYLK